MKSFRRSRKGISPIFATLILIAIAVIAGVVVYMFTSGTLATMTGGGTAAQEKVSVQGAAISKANGVTVYAQSTNQQAVTLSSLIVKDTSGNTIATASSATILTADGALVTVGPAAWTSGGANIVAGNYYTVTVVTTKGGSFVSSQVIATA